ncbi:hypothetical protein E2C01_076862 [Portunus trituberculatus]|uniref:Uncharacterized protein n=1 Tax=Portunus trituberculatus TaxID=210409 RepID=A0A5B7IIT3_PORTR|nr:hypothetical protein [Portunus trituberculatus]
MVWWCHWSCCDDGVPGVERVFVSQEPRVFHWPRQRKGRPRVLQVPTTDKEEEEEEEEEEERREEEPHSFGGDIGNYRVRRDKVKRRLG